MILTGSAIGQAVDRGEICLDPFDRMLLNPNSYNYRLGSILRTDMRAILDPLEEPELAEQRIPEGGITLDPKRLYLGTTLERIGSTEYVPTLIGRSSLGRLGLFLQVSADLGQLGAIHQWTLELVAVQPIHIYAGMVIGQVSFWHAYGDRLKYEGYYGTRSDAAPCEPAAVANRFRKPRGRR
jgi:dCTP deaminase